VFRRALGAVVVATLAVIVYVMERFDPGEYDEDDEEAEWWPWVEEESDDA
jgi:hypothetical protein